MAVEIDLLILNSDFGKLPANGSGNFVAGAGDVLRVSRCNVLQHKVVQTQISDETLQFGVLLLQFLQLLRRLA